jgi:hypothetical protein
MVAGGKLHNPVAGPAELQAAYARLSIGLARSLGVDAAKPAPLIPAHGTHG